MYRVDLNCDLGESFGRYKLGLDEEVIKYHRTCSTYINTLIENGFNIVKISEPVPPKEMVLELIQDF